MIPVYGMIGHVQDRRHSITTWTRYTCSKSTYVVNRHADMQMMSSLRYHAVSNSCWHCIVQVYCFFLLTVSAKGTTTHHKILVGLFTMFKPIAWSWQFLLAALTQRQIAAHELVLLVAIGCHNLAVTGCKALDDGNRPNCANASTCGMISLLCIRVYWRSFPIVVIVTEECV